MKLFNKNTQKYSSILFFGIFIIFLSLSVLHTHNYYLSFSNEKSISVPVTKNTKDVFLDSSSNCIIHSLVNSLKLDSAFILSDKINISDDQIAVPIIQFYTNNLSELAHLLRAPPISFS